MTERADQASGSGNPERAEVVREGEDGEARDSDLVGRQRLRQQAPGERPRHG